jgi:ADP-ribose pyrophosphatase
MREYYMLNENNKKTDKAETIKFTRNKLELAYSAHIFDIYNDYLTLPDGKQVVYDYIDHVPGACILPVDESGRIILVSQYRNSIDDITYEVPAGCMDKDESPEQCAVRELQEETGYIANEVEFITKTVLAIGTSNEQTYIYIGRNLTRGKLHRDNEEFLNVHVLTKEEIMNMIKAGKIVDSKTLIAIYAYFLRI